ncbi:glycoside hydrolase family 2 TIM barrel-domain containing protein [Maribacter aurantiacus]|uniref:Glycosyl hydrolase family 5 n=1 Tax=Maribacter aurantiacus TaxID=1882343 RepID=A0A5R8M6L3_9FLAO|nr:glycoside hydrolase family 2 TIM barrel-domain containing protein [Maribacter aurantiacus]TLF44409.1 glycosyl hydrolase family 5 [Maribacter aurantiacus]
MRLNRTIYQTLLIVSFLALNALIIFGISAVWSYLNSGADRSKMLHLPEKLTASYLPKVQWNLEYSEGRPIEEQTLNEIERDYLKSWQVKSIALETNNRYGLSDYFTDSARVKLYDLIELNQSQNITIKTTSIKHNPKLEFYSADGKLAVLTDYNVEHYQETYLQDRLLHSQNSTNTYQVLLLLEDGFWRVRHMVQMDAGKKRNIANTIQNLDESLLSKVKGVNYYPKDHPWDMFGSNFKDSIIYKDFKKIKDLGLNSIRIFVPYESFGKAEVDSVKLGQLSTTLDIAQKFNLKVIVTLFDFYGDYGIQDWTLTHRHAEQIVEALKNHEALLGWDLKNEPDLDFESRGKSNVLAWLRNTLEEIKEWDSEHPITIGWSNAKAAQNLSEEVDYVSFHYYLDPDNFTEAYSLLKTAVPDKPIVLQEYGYSSYSGFWNAYMGSERKQSSYFKKIQEGIESQGIPSIFWTLYDFDLVPNSVVGRLPWRKSKQKYFGLLDKNGNPKEVVKVIVDK